MPDWSDKVAFMRQLGLVSAKWDSSSNMLECTLGPAPETTDARVEERVEAAPKEHRPLAHAYPGLRRNSQFVKRVDEDA